MGRTKEIVDMLVEEGGASECPVHLDIYIDNEDPDADETVAEQWAEQNGIGIEEARRQVRDAKGNGELYDECPICAKNAEDD